MFEVGEQATALHNFYPDNTGIGLNEGQTYTVEGVDYCHNCGAQGLCVGHYLPSEYLGTISICKCGAKKTIHRKEIYFGSWRFVKNQTVHEMGEALEEAKQILEMEMA